MMRVTKLDMPKGQKIQILLQTMDRSGKILNQKLWLTPKEFEKEFSIRQSTQAKMRMSRRIPYHKIGKYV